MNVRNSFFILILLISACTPKNDTNQVPESQVVPQKIPERPIYLEAYHHRWTFNVLGKSIDLDAYGWCEEPTSVPCIAKEVATIKQGDKLFRIYREFDSDPKHPKFNHYNSDTAEYKRAEIEYQRIKAKEVLIEGSSDIDLEGYLKGYEREIRETFSRCKTSKFGKFVKNMIEEDRKRNVALIFKGAFPLDSLSRALVTTVEVDSNGDIQNVGTEQEEHSTGFFGSPIISYESFTSPEKRLLPSNHRIAFPNIARFGFLCQLGQEYSAHENHFELPQICKLKKYRFYFPLFNEQIDPRASKYIDYELEDPSKYLGEPTIMNLSLSRFASASFYPPPTEEFTDQDKLCLLPIQKETSNDKK